MPAASEVFCAHCGKYLPRRLEREHRKLATSPYASPPPTFQSRVCRVVDADSDSDETPPTGRTSSLVGDEAPMDIGDLVDGDTGPFSKSFDSLRDHWHHMFEAEDSDSDGDLDDELPYDKLEDSDNESESGFVDWDAVEAGSGLSAWDRLGESYEKEAAAIGKHLLNNLRWEP
jgi:hypothetical protein